MNTLAINFPISIRYRLVLSPKIFWLIGFILVVSLLAFYIVQVNSLAKESSLIQGHQKKMNKLSGENEISEINFSKFNSLTNLENYLFNPVIVPLSGTGSWEKTKKVKYIQILEEQVVKK